MAVRNGQAIEWSTKDHLVWGKWRTYNKVRRIAPQFRYGTEPKGLCSRGNYCIEDRGTDRYAVICEISGYVSLHGTSKLDTRELVFEGSLKQCKAWMADFIKKCYDEQEGG